MLGQLFGVVVGSVVAYEVVKKYKAMRATTAMISGHPYSIALTYTKDPAVPVTQAYVQSLLDAQESGGFEVMSANMTPGPQSGIRQMALSVVRSGPTKDVPNTIFQTGWTPDYGTVTVSAATDMGGAPAAGALPGL